MDSPPDLQIEVMRALFDLGPATVRQVHERVGVARGLAYTTIGTVIERLHAKGSLRRARDGRGYLYEAVGQRAEVERSRAGAALERLLGPKPQASVAALVDALYEIDPGLLDELDREVAARRGRPNGA